MQIWRNSIRMENSSAEVGDSSETGLEEWIIRRAVLEDARQVAEILAQAFPSLYESTFGVRGEIESADFLFRLYLAGNLTLGDTLLYVAKDRVLGVAILHAEGYIGKGDLWKFREIARSSLGLFRGARAFFGGIAANLLLARRIPHAPDLIYIEGLAVRDGFRNQGIGSKLLEEVERQARNRGLSRIALHVLNRNTGAHKLYLRTGFKPWGKTPESDAPQDAPLSPPWAAMLMVRNLGEIE